MREGNMVGVAGVATYVYDALNHRVETVTASGTQQYLFHPGGQRAATLDAAGSAVSEPSYFAGGSVAYFRGGGFHYQHQDWLGTERVRTSSAGSVDGTFSSLPFGDGYTTTGVDTDASHFTGLDRDSTGLSHAMFRDYSSVTGTWMRPDPYAGSYDQGNPQTLNRYAYVSSNPLGSIDPLGLKEKGDASSSGYCSPEFAKCDQNGPDWFEGYWYVGSGSGQGIPGGKFPGGGLGGIFNWPGAGCKFGACGFQQGSGGTYPSSSVSCLIGDCRIVLYWHPVYPPGNACTGRKANGQQADFYSMWDCIGTVAACKKNEDRFKDACSVQGNVPMQCTRVCNVQAGGCVYSCHCCHY